MAYTVNDIYDYIVENNKEAEFLNALGMHKGNYSIGEIVDRKFEERGDGYYLVSELYNLDLKIEDEDIFTALHNGLYVSAFISRKDKNYNLHFLAHRYPITMKAQFDDQILKEVIRYMISMTVVSLKISEPRLVDEYIKE